MTDAAESRLKDVGLLLLRVAFGVMFVTLHGWAKMMAGPGMWEKVGGAMGNLGVHFLPVFWGFMAAFSELVGGACIALGLLTRPMAALLAFTMVVAATMHLTHGDGFGVAKDAIQYGAVAFILILTGAGRFSIDQRIFGRRKAG